MDWAWPGVALRRCVRPWAVQNGAGVQREAGPALPVLHGGFT